MPATTRSLRRGLTLCLLAAGAGAHAQQPSGEMLWNCTSVDDGREWDCAGNPALPEDGRAPAPPGSVEEPAAAPAEAPSGPSAAAPPVAEPIAEPAPAPRPYLQAYPRSYARPETVAAGMGVAGPQWQCAPDGEASHWECEALPVASTATPAPAAAGFAELDWYPNPGGAVDPKTHCDGRYIEPILDLADAALPGDEQPIYVEAERSYTEGGEQTRLEGDILLRQGENQVRSQSALVHHRLERASLEGLVQFRQPGTLMLGDSARVDLNSDTTVVENARFVFHPQHLRGRADRVVSHGNGITTITRGAYTRCEPGNDSWMLHGSEIVLDRNKGFGSARHATIRVGGVPVFYVPLIHFPIDDRRQTGFLTPSLAHTEDNGLDIQAPYYFNLAPHYDDTLTPRYIARRGMMLENEFRYLHRLGRVELSTAFLPNDDITGEDRWALGVDHSGAPAPGWSSRIDFNAVSDDDYFEELDTSLNITRATHLDQLAQLHYQADQWQGAARVQDYQTISSTAVAPYRKLPELRFSGAPTDLPLDYRAEYTRFTRDPSGFTGLARATGGRLHLETTLARSFQWPWAFVNPRLRLTHTRYQLDNMPEGSGDEPERTLPLVSLDSGLFFEREARLGERSWLHTLEPRLFYLYVPFEDQRELPNFDSAELSFTFNQLFRDNRFSGLDRIGDTHQVTLGLTSRVLKDNGGEWLRGSVGQIFYLEDREVRLNASAPPFTDERSPIAADAVWSLTENLRLSADALWDKDLDRNLERNFKAAYRSDIDHQLSVGYRYTADNLEQLDVSAIWPLNPRWSLLTRWLQDRLNSEPLDRIAGLEYENCCWRIRAIYRKWVDDDTDSRENNGLFLQFALKGLGTVGTRASGDQGPEAKHFLEEISGFQEREDYDN